MSQTVPRRLDRVLALIRENTLKAAELNFTDTIGLTASGLAVEAGLDRTNVSKELNRLYRQGLVIKCQGKPTLFLHRAALASLSPRHFSQVQFRAPGVSPTIWPLRTRTTLRPGNPPTAWRP